MCGICGIAGEGWGEHQLKAMIDIQNHRGPDDQGMAIESNRQVGLGHNRLSIIDLSKAGAQPMSNHANNAKLVFNGEIYNYLELKQELSDYPFQSESDSEVILAAYQKWGVDCLDHLIGMFAFALWDDIEQRLFLARDRFGVKPLYYSIKGDRLYWASEIKALHAAGIPAKTNSSAWGNYLRYGLYEHTVNTFWQDVYAIPPGGALTWEKGQINQWIWYDLAHLAGQPLSEESLEETMLMYQDLLEQSVKFRFRSDVPLAINLSGGLDSSILLGMVDRIFGKDSDVRAFTFVTGNPDYDETPWVSQMLSRTKHPHEICTLQPLEIPDLALQVQRHQDEPFGGFPTLAYSKIFERARSMGYKVLLDGQGMDEQWAGYDYYLKYLDSNNTQLSGMGPVQGSLNSPVKPDCLTSELLKQTEPFTPPQVFSEPLTNAQYKDTRFTKIPRALRFNDRISMMHSTELREPFLDHRLFELAFRQPKERKINHGIQKFLLRKIAHELLPQGVVEAPKRPLQTPQREWLKGPLKSWVNDCLSVVGSRVGGDWLKMDRVYSHWQKYQQGESDNSFYIWQWVNLALWLEVGRDAPVSKQSG